MVLEVPQRVEECVPVCRWWVRGRVQWVRGVGAKWASGRHGWREMCERRTTHKQTVEETWTGDHRNATAKSVSLTASSRGWDSIRSCRTHGKSMLLFSAGLFHPRSFSPPPPRATKALQSLLPPPSPPRARSGGGQVFVRTGRPLRQLSDWRPLCRNARPVTV